MFLSLWDLLPRCLHILHDVNAVLPVPAYHFDSSIASKMVKHLMQEKPEGVENEAVEQVHYAVVRAEPALAASLPARWPLRIVSS